MKRTKTTRRTPPQRRRTFNRRLRLESLEHRLVLTTIDLSNVRQSGVAIFGSGAEDESGISVSNVGDMNGDGYEDILIGARKADAASNAKVSAGEAYLVFGKPNWSSTLDLSNLGTDGVTFLGADAGDYAGRAVSGAGDVNGDGFDDLLIGSVSADAASNAKQNAGESYLIFGKGDWSGTPTINLASLGNAGVVFFGADAYDYSGLAVSAAGDVNGDGFDDFLIGVHYGDAMANAKIGAGETALVFGRASWPQSLDLSSLGTGGVTILGADPSDASGFAVAGAGDVNGDGFDDVLIGARYADGLNNDRNASGESYLIFGKANWSTTSTIDLANLGAAGVVIYGVDAYDYSGISVSGAGDVNGDGFDDVLVGATGGDGASNNKLNVGDSYLIFGKANWATTRTINLASLGVAGVEIHGVDDSDLSGLEVSGGGDINGDGFDDLIIGARYADAGGNTKNNAGDAYVIFGQDDLSNRRTLSLASASNLGIALLGASALDYGGITVSHAGDVDGDGFDDWLIGAPGGDGSNDNRTLSGESYLLFGGNGFSGSVTHLGNEQSQTLTGNVGDNVMVAGQGNDVLLGRGGEDAMRGGQGDDILAIEEVELLRLVGGRGIDTLRLDGSGLALNLTTIPDNRIMGIEEINITGSGANALTLNVREVLNISGESNRLVVFRDANDTVELGTGWTQQANQTIDGNTFEVFVQGLATLLVQATFADVVVTNTPSATSVVAGTSFTYAINITNNGPASATGVRLTDTLAPELTFDPLASSGGCTVSARTVTCNIGTVASGASVTRNIVVKLASSATNGAVLENTANVIQNETDPTPANRTASSSVTVLRRPDLGIAATASANTVNAGTGFSFTVDVNNQGPSDASNVRVQSTLPNGLSFNAATSSVTCSAAGQLVTCNLGAMATTASAARQIGVLTAPTVSDASVLTVSFDVLQTETDPNPANNEVEVDVTVNRRADLRVLKVAPANPVLAGGSFSYTLEFANLGPSAASAVTITDALPPGLTFDAANSSNLCSAVGQDVTCNLGQLGPSTSDSLILHVLVGAGLAEGELITNSASIGGAEIDPVAANNTSVAAVTITRNANPTPWHNSRDPRDVNNDGFVTPIDVLQIINELNNRRFTTASGAFTGPPPSGQFPYLDVTADNFATPLDALQIINFLNEGGGEGEARSTLDTAAIAWFAAFAAASDESDEELDDVLEGIVDEYVEMLR